MAREIKLPLPSADKVFADVISSQDERDDAKREKVMKIPLSEIDPFPNHPFLVKQDEEMQNMVESVKTFGIQTPAIVRPKADERYELISGHRRKMACEIVGIAEIPCIVRKLNDMDAVVSMVDSNLQRETILPSEKAKSYKMRLDAMKRQSGRPKNNSVPVAQNYEGKTSRELLGEKVGESQDQIRRYIRLNELIPQILDMVDNSVIRDKSNLQIAMRPAVELSYIPKEQQEILLEEMVSSDSTPSHDQAIKMRSATEGGQLDENMIHSIMREIKPNQVEQFKMPKERISKFFAPNTSSQKIEETIVKALEELRQRERNRNRDAR